MIVQWHVWIVKINKYILNLNYMYCCQFKLISNTFTCVLSYWDMHYLHTHIYWHKLLSIHTIYLTSLLKKLKAKVTNEKSSEIVIKLKPIILIEYCKSRQHLIFISDELYIEMIMTYCPAQCKNFSFRFRLLFILNNTTFFRLITKSNFVASEP